MDYPAAPKPGRRVSFGAAAVLAGFLLLAPPLFVLTPFVLLTLFSRPSSLRELVWLVAAGTALGLSLQVRGGLGVEVFRASGLLVGVVFALLSLRASGSLLARGLLAVLLGALLLIGWEWSRGVSWPEVERAFTAMLREGYQSMAGAPAPAGSATGSDSQTLLGSLIDAAPQLARALPGLLALEGLAGVGLAWGWHHRIATHPRGRPPAPFREFRFNDHLILGGIFNLALLIAPLPDPAAVIAENLLILWVGLYAARGLAIMATVLSGAPAALKLLTGGLALLLSPLALGGCLALGLADTWLDLRARLRPPAPGGT